MATPTTAPSNAVPALAAERAVNWPKRVKAKLSNSLEIVLVESHSIPRFHGQLYFRSGSAAVSHLAPGTNGYDGDNGSHRNCETRQPPNRRRFAAAWLRSFFQRGTGSRARSRLPV